MGIIEREVSFRYDPSKIYVSTGETIYPCADFAKSLFMEFYDMVSSLYSGCSYEIVSDGTDPDTKVESYNFVGKVSVNDRTITISGTTVHSNHTRESGLFGADAKGSNSGQEHYRIVFMYNDDAFAIAVSDACVPSEDYSYNQLFAYTYAENTLTLERRPAECNPNIIDGKVFPSSSISFYVDGEGFSVYPYERVISKTQEGNIIFSKLYSETMKYRICGFSSISRSSDGHIVDERGNNFFTMGDIAMMY